MQHFDQYGSRQVDSGPHQLMRPAFILDSDESFQRLTEQAKLGSDPITGFMLHFTCVAVYLISCRRHRRDHNDRSNVYREVNNRWRKTLTLRVYSIHL